MDNYDDFQSVVDLFSLYMDGANGDLDIDESQLETLKRMLNLIMKKNPKLRDMLKTILHPDFCDVAF